MAVSEVCKELAFGAAFGLCAGFVGKKFGSAVVGGMCAGSFLLFRCAIFEGRYCATWSPLAIDDASFSSHLLRKAKKETGIRGDVSAFLKDNAYVFGGFAGGFVLTAN